MFGFRNRLKSSGPPMNSGGNRKKSIPGSPKSISYIPCSHSCLKTRKRIYPIITCVNTSPTMIWAFLRVRSIPSGLPCAAISLIMKTLSTWTGRALSAPTRAADITIRTELLSTQSRYRPGGCTIKYLTYIRFHRSIRFAICNKHMWNRLSELQNEFTIPRVLPVFVLKTCGMRIYPAGRSQKPAFSF